MSFTFNLSLPNCENAHPSNRSKHMIIVIPQTNGCVFFATDSCSSSEIVQVNTKSTLNELYISCTYEKKLTCISQRMICTSIRLINICNKNTDHNGTDNGTDKIWIIISEISTSFIIIMTFAFLHKLYTKSYTNQKAPDPKCIFISH